jgi:hypothetical protein
MGVFGVLKCGALVKLEAVSVGVKAPVSSWPLAWAVICQFEIMG